MELWPNLSSLSVAPLGRDCYEFQFHSIEEMRKSLAQGIEHTCPDLDSVNASPTGILEGEDFI